MARPPRTDRPVTKNINIPTSVLAQVELRLYSEVEGRVPHGTLSTLITELLKAWLAAQPTQEAQ